MPTGGARRGAASDLAAQVGGHYELPFLDMSPPLQPVAALQPAAAAAPQSSLSGMPSVLPHPSPPLTRARAHRALRSHSFFR